jgi:NarL family two-component system response regulator YdfI
MILHPAIALNFAFEFAKKLLKIKSSRIRYGLYASLYLIPLLLIYKNITEFVINTQKMSGFWYFFYLAYYAVYMLTTLILIFLWGKITPLIKERKQASIILIFTIFAVLLCYIVDVGRLFIGMSDKPFLTPVLLVFWYMGMAYAIIKYRLLSTHVKMTGDDIINNFDESVLILDAEGSILKMNDKTKQLLAASNLSLPQELSTVIVESEQVIKKIRQMMRGYFESFSSRIHYKRGKSNVVLMDVKVTLVSDNLDDIIGVMIIGNEVQATPRFKDFYKITEREFEVINLILGGDSNRKIANELGISERTVKTHITNIYNKLFIDNKIQLINFIKDHKLFPEQPAEKRLLLFRNN